jgi:bifunctional DNase/RNase
MDKLKLKIMGISSGHNSSSYTLILEEEGGNRKLPIIIGSFEAQAVAIEIEKIVPVRPMTHDLFKSLADAFELDVKEVVIHRLHEGIFYANIMVEREGDTQEIDARTSDAIALAIRFGCPIYTYTTIMDEAGIVLSESESEMMQRGEEEEASGQQQEQKQSARSSKSSTPASGENLSQYNLSELQNMLEQALENENYIFAARLRDEIQSRNA